LDFDPKNLQLSPEQVAQWTAKAAVSRRPPRQIGHFVMGPIPLAWLGPAARLPGKALAVGLAIWYQRGLRKSETVMLTGPILNQFGVDRHAKYRALTALENAGLVRVDRRMGKNPTVEILKTTESTKTPSLSLTADSNSNNPKCITDEAITSNVAISPLDSPDRR